jgi:hypothetical protein
MTRKDYTALAAALANVRPIHGEDARFHAQFNLDAHAVADVLAADNARFDRARFLAACGVES